MKFYLANVDGRRVIASTQADAKELDKNFERLDIPTDHEGLKAFVQDLYDKIDTPSPAFSDPSAGQQEAVGVQESPPPAPISPAREALVERGQIEELWPSLSLNFRFHLCALTMEEARATKWPASADQATA